MNKPLQSLWKRTPDDVYLQPSWDYKTYAFESLGESALWVKAFKQPVVAVFDVVLQISPTVANPKPIVLLQPRPKLQELFPTRAASLDGIRDKTVVNRIGDSLYAMGHLNYPLVNLADPYRQIELPTRENQGCFGIGCYTGVRFTEREGAKSRISRLIEAGPGNKSMADHVVPRAVAETNFENAIPTTSEIAATPLPSLPSFLNPGGKFVDPQFLGENTRPKAGGTPMWTLVLPFVGGFLAIWFLLRKLIRTASIRNDRPTRPLQNSPASVTTSLLNTGKVQSRSPGIGYSSFPGATTYADADSDGMHPVASTSQEEESNEFDEKKIVLSENNDEEANLSLALEDARVGSGLGISMDTREAEESQADDGDAQDNKRKTRRGNRGKNKNKKPKAQATPPQNSATAAGSSEPVSGQDSSSASADYVLVEQPRGNEVPPKMELPLPVTTSSSSLVVTSKVLGMQFFPNYRSRDANLD